jgi:hypothetical protein
MTPLLESQPRIGTSLECKFEGIHRCVLFVVHSSVRARARIGLFGLLPHVESNLGIETNASDEFFSREKFLESHFS